MKKIILITAIVLVGILIIGGYLFFGGPKPVQTPQQNDLKTEDIKKTDDASKIEAAQDKAVEATPTGVLPDIQTNPLEEKPDLNPIDKTNPYKNIKTNPFK